jgi:hypothetical protein
MLPSSHPTTTHPKARRRVTPATDYRPKTAKLENPVSPTKYHR